MKVLWIVNTIFPELAINLQEKPTVYGGWMYGLADMISNVEGIELFIVSVYNGKYIERKINNKSYILLSRNDSSKWEELAIKVNPDVVHIHGVEYSYGLDYIKANGGENVVFSIQGLKSVIAKYYLGGLGFWDVIKNVSFRDIVKLDGLYKQQKRFFSWGKKELDYFILCQNVIGRTTWDRTYSYYYNKNLKYHFCNEMLRFPFYSARKWSYEKCNKNTIFLSQGAYPIKGVHMVIKALAMLKNYESTIKVRIGGYNIIDRSNLMAKLKIGTYGRYIEKIIKKYKLEKQVVFLGNLDEEAMIQEYLSCNIFICPSAIENSPNSLGEAQLLGVPCIASYVGGIPDMVQDRHNGLLYRYEEEELLASSIEMLLSDVKLQNELSKNAVIASERRHCIDDIVRSTIDIYKVIAKY